MPALETLVMLSLLRMIRTIVMKDAKSATSFSQTKAIPPALWKACDYMQQFNFKIAQIAR